MFSSIPISQIDKKINFITPVVPDSICLPPYSSWDSGPRFGQGICAWVWRERAVAHCWSAQRQRAPRAETDISHPDTNTKLLKIFRTYTVSSNYCAFFTTVKRCESGCIRTFRQFIVLLSILMPASFYYVRVLFFNNASFTASQIQFCVGGCWDWTQPCRLQSFIDSKTHSSLGYISCWTGFETCQTCLT